MKAEDCIVANELLPQPRFEGVWEAVIVADDIKDRLVNHSLLAFRLRQKLPFIVTALHGLVLLYGPPGTGKTTLARGLAQQLGPLVAGGKVRLIEVNPHGLMSPDHGKSQQHVFDLLCEHIPLLADDGVPTVVLLDEVESMAVARSETALSANPVDVHRATDAVLMALDRNTQNHPHIITVATSNFTGSLDEAFRSRADLAIEIPLPDAAAIHAILARTLSDFGSVYPALATLARQPGLVDVATAMVGLDGRRVRKTVTEALGGARATVADPERLTLPQLADAATRLAEADEDQGASRAAA